MLEATYSDRPDEHRSWRELRDELEAKKRKLCDEALAATKVWTQPELADREEVQTRYNSRPTSYLLLAQTLESTANGRYRVVLLDGVSIEVDDDDWSFPVAKAIHWNLVRVPRYAVERALSDAPEWLRLHVAGEIALGLVNDGIIFWPGQDQPSGLTWHPDEGVFIPVSATTRGKVPLSRDTEDDYESYD